MTDGTVSVSRTSSAEPFPASSGGRDLDALGSQTLGQRRHERIPGFRKHHAICACSNCAVWSGAGQTYGPFNYSQRLSSEALWDGGGRTEQSMFDPSVI